MPGAETPPRALPGPAGAITLDPARPLHLCHPAPRLVLAVVSIAWLHSRGDAVRQRLAARYLTAEEAAHAATLRLPERRCEWLAGRLALKHGVSAYQQRYSAAAAEPRGIRVRRIEVGPQAGRPVVDAPVEVGLSHSAGFAVAACGAHAVGVDLEHQRTVPPLLSEILSRDGHPGSPDPGARRLAAMPLPLRWACREAVLKHYGVGLRVDSREVVLTGWHGDGRFTWRAGPGLLRRAPAAERGCRASWAQAVDGYFLALVWS